MARCASPFEVYISQMYAWSNIEDAKPYGYLGTEINATDKCLHTHSKARAYAGAHEGYCISPYLLREIALKRLKIHKHLINTQL